MNRLNQIKSILVDVKRFLQYGDLPTSYYKKRGLVVGTRFNRQSGCKLDPSHCWLIQIGDDVTLSNRVQILAHDDSTRSYTGCGKVGTVKIGNNVFVGAGTTILMNVKIGNNVIIGAESLVTKDIPDNSVAFGVPARVICPTQQYLDKVRKDMTNKPVFDLSYTIYHKVTDDKKETMKKILACDYGYQKLDAANTTHQYFSDKQIGALEHSPVVSVIVPVYNTGRFLSKCIKSILAQTVTDIEIILVNDGSTDDSLDIMNYFAVRDKRIKVIDKQNGGLASARNAGLDIAEGEFISFVDSDDWIGRTFLEKLLEAARCSGQIDIVISRLTLIDTVLHSNVTMPRGGWDNRVFFGMEKEQKLLLPLLGPAPKRHGSRQPINYLQMCVWKNLYRKSLIDQYSLRFYSEREIMLEDFDFNIRAYLYARGIGITDSTEYYHLLVKTSLSKSYRPEKLKMMLKLIERTGQFIEQEQSFLSSKAQVRYHYNSFIRRSCIDVMYNWSVLSDENSYRAIKDKIEFILKQPVFEAAFSQNHKTADNFYYRFFMFLIRKRQIVLLTYCMILSHTLNYAYRLYIKILNKG